MQEVDLSFFTQSKLQEDITLTYLKEWASRHYANNDKFLNWVKSAFKVSNFLSFFKYLRNPLASAKLINDEVKPQLQRVFHAEDSYFKYSIKGKDISNPEELHTDYFDKALFDSILFRHNDVVVSDIDEVNKDHREIVSIQCVIAVDSKKGKIQRIAYASSLNGLNGYSYIDSQRYVFLTRDNFTVVLDVPHDLGYCPADWVSSENMFSDNDIIKKSLFSYVKVDLEEYVFLKTLQRMTEPNGAIPVTTKLKTTDTKIPNKLQSTISDKEPMSALSIGAQKASIDTPPSTSDSELQAGTIVSVPAKTKNDGAIDMDVIKSYFQFHYIPVEALTYLNDRINELQNNIITSILGDYQEQTVQAVNEKQVSKSLDNKKDKLRWMSDELTRIKKRSDFTTLALIYGKDNVSVDVFFGTDFFLESQDKLFSDFAKAPNAIERRNILLRLSQNRNKYNTNKANREKILYKIIPFASDLDFEKAQARPNLIDDTTFKLQTRFDYWIAKFESQYGDIGVFFQSLENMDDNGRLLLINSLIKTIIQNEQN
ncbi:hypothetical protein CMT52_18015 [Elizabethkingia anophelis]|nr:hypothetical protein [Elizabethkingia anophelis]